MLSEVSQRETKTACFHLYSESKKWNKLTITKQRKTHRYKQQASDNKWGEEWGKGRDGEGY